MAANSVIDVDEVSEIVTKFLLRTYRLQPTEHDIAVAAQSAMFASRHADDEPEEDFIRLISGSSAELYVKPMLPCIGDFDLMRHTSTELAIPAGDSAPTSLPAKFHSLVQVYEITDSDYPGYVYLKPRYILTKSNHVGRYNAIAVRNDRNEYYTVTTQAIDGVQQHGPALTEPGDEAYSPIDFVFCVRCLSWPPQAADWPTRHRNYDWPDSATVGRVVSNGGDVVHVAHRLCRQDECESKYQWRLSFSRAEAVLLNSWKPVQQVVYHMLRTFTKSIELRDITDRTGTKIISNYHIKTLMLWTCELKPKCWWIPNTNVVRICVELLHTLGAWLTDARCKHYFIDNCNLMDSVMDADMLVLQLTSVTESELSTWFVKNYILKCAQLCPDNVSRMFDDVSTSVKLQTAASAVVDRRQKTACEDLWLAYELATLHIAVFSNLQSLHTTRLCVRMKDMLTMYDIQLYNYITATELLHCALKLSKHGAMANTSELVQSMLQPGCPRFRDVSQLVQSLIQQCQSTTMSPTEVKTSELVELLQRSAVEYLTAYRQSMARKFATVLTIVTTDYEAMYAYKRGDYQLCLQMSTQNVRTLLNGRTLLSSNNKTDVLTCPEFIQLLDDDIVSLTALTLLVNPKCRHSNNVNVGNTQLTLSLYLITQCQLKLRHSATQLAQTLHYISVAHTRCLPQRTLDHLVLKLAKRKAVLHIQAL